MRESETHKYAQTARENARIGRMEERERERR
jgi:hypothetical protein